MFLLPPAVAWVCQLPSNHLDVVGIGHFPGHAGAIVSGGKGTAEAKLSAMTDAGMHVVNSPTKLGEAIMAEMKAAGLA